MAPESSSAGGKVAFDELSLLPTETGGIFVFRVAVDGIGAVAIGVIATAAGNKKGAA